MRHQKNSFKKEEWKEDKRIKTQALGSILEVYTPKGQLLLLHLPDKLRLNRKSAIQICHTSGAFHTKIGGWSYAILSRGQCARPMLQMQYPTGRKSVYIWPEIRGRKSKRTLRSQTEVS